MRTPHYSGHFNLTQLCPVQRGSTVLYASIKHLELVITSSRHHQEYMCPDNIMYNIGISIILMVYVCMYVYLIWYYILCVLMIFCSLYRKMAQMRQSLGSHGNDDEDSWLPVHVQVMEVERGDGGEGEDPVVNGDHHEENLFDLNKPVTNDQKCNKQFELSMLNGDKHRDCDELRQDSLGKDIIFHSSKEQEVVDMLQRRLQEKCAALLERETQLEVIKRERFELSVRVQHLQKEVSVVKTRNSRLEQDLLSKEAEIQQLKLNGQSKCVLHLYCVHIH